MSIHIERNAILLSAHCECFTGTDVVVIWLIQYSTAATYMVEPRIISWLDPRTWYCLDRKIWPNTIWLIDQDNRSIEMSSLHWELMYNSCKIVLGRYCKFLLLSVYRKCVSNRQPFHTSRIAEIVCRASF